MNAADLIQGTTCAIDYTSTLTPTSAQTITDTASFNFVVTSATGTEPTNGADAAISDAESLLEANNLNLLTSYVAPSSTLRAKLIADTPILCDYNNANFKTSTEGSLLTPAIRAIGQPRRGSHTAAQALRGSGSFLSERPASSLCLDGDLALRRGAGEAI